MPKQKTKKSPQKAVKKMLKKKYFGQSGFAVIGIVVAAVVTLVITSVVVAQVNKNQTPGADRSSQSQQPSSAVSYQVPFSSPQASKKPSSTPASKQGTKTTQTPSPTPSPHAAAAPSPTSSVSSSPSPTGVSGNWLLVFSDDFSGSSLNSSKWSNCWFPPTCGTQNGVSTSPSNVSVTGGNLVLTLASSSSGASVSTNPNGGVSPGFTFTTGVVEARIHFPGNGSECYNWPAWWTNGQNWPNTGENDIAEVLDGGDMTVNYHSSSGSHNQGKVPGYWCGGFHTYTLHRKATSSDVYYDGVKVKSYVTNDGNAPHYLLLNVGKSGGSNVAYGTASQVKVDYVRAWQN